VFQSPADFERKACEALGGWIRRLGGHSFHVRMHRRGFEDRLGSQAEEQFLDHWLIEQVQTAGSSALITFEDPDDIIAVETVGQRAGASIWDRHDRARYAFLGLDGWPQPVSRGPEPPTRRGCNAVGLPAAAEPLYLLPVGPTPQRDRANGQARRRGVAFRTFPATQAGLSASTCSRTTTVAFPRQG